MQSPRASLLVRIVFPAALSVLRCHAQVDAWEFEVYPYATTQRGVAEFETDNAFVASGHALGGDGVAYGTVPSDKTFYNAYEFTYGLTDRIEAAVYLKMAQPNDSGLQWAGDNIRLRGRLFDEDVLPINVGWYAELEWHKTPQFDDAKRELELRPILEKDFGRLSLMANPIFEKVLAGVGHNQGFEFGYDAEIAWRGGRALSPGLEFYGGCGVLDHADPVREQQHYIFPVVWGELPCGLEYNFGVGKGLTKGSDQTIFKFNIELERFIGAIFKASPDNSCFF